MRKAALIAVLVLGVVALLGGLTPDARMTKQGSSEGKRQHRYTAYMTQRFTLDEGASLSRDLFVKALVSGSRSLYRRAFSKVVEIDGVAYDREDAIDKIEAEFGRAVRAGQLRIRTDANPTPQDLRGVSGRPPAVEHRLRLIPQFSEDVQFDNHSAGVPAHGEVSFRVDSVALAISALHVPPLGTAETNSNAVSDGDFQRRAAGSVMIGADSRPPNKRLQGAKPKSTAVSTSGQSLIHVLLHDEDPEIRRLSMNFTMTELDRRLVGSMRGAAMSNIEGADSLYGIEPQIILMDASWQRLLTVTDKSSAIKAWWSEFGIPDHNRQFPIAIDIDNGDWSGSTNPGANVYLVEYGDRPLVLHLFFSAFNSVSLVDSLSLSSDSLLEPSDCVLDDNGTVGNPNDDSLWVLDYGARSVVRYSCMGSSGRQAAFQLPTGTGAGELEYPTRLAVGRSFPQGGATDELYVLDKNGKVARFLAEENGLQFETEHVFASALGGANTLQDLAVDAYGHVYVIESPSSRIYKLSSDLELIDVYDNKGELPSQCYLPLTIQNPPSSESYAAYGDLILSEYWGMNSGAQRYAIGVLASNLTASPSPPYAVTLGYVSSDPHYLSLAVERQALSGGDWAAVQSSDLGLYYSGPTEGIRWAVADTGFSYLYRFTLTLRSTYFPWKDPWNIHPDDPTDPDDVQTNVAMLSYEVDMGNIVPTIVDSLAFRCVVGSPTPCIAVNTPYWLEIGAQDSDSPGSLSYKWEATYNPNIRFLDPSSGWVSSLSGPWESVRMIVLSSGSPVLLGPPGQVRVTVTDGGHATAVDQLTFDVDCGALNPFCPYQGDLNGDEFINAIDLNALIDVLFFLGVDVKDQSCPYWRSDLDATGYTDALDLNWMIDFQFFGGPAPVSPCAEL